MKTLRQYIKESTDNKNKTHESYKYYTFSLNNINHGDSVVDSIYNMCQTKGIYAEKIESGVKVKITNENITKADFIIELLNNFVSSIPSEKHEEIGEPLNKLVKEIEKLSNDIEDAISSESDNDDNKKEGKKENNKNTEEE